MKTLLLTLTYLVGIGELILAIYFWATNSKSEVRRVMALLSISTSVWVLTSALTSYAPQTPITTLWMRIVFAMGALLVTSLLHLALVYPYQIIRLDRVHGWLLYAPTTMWSFISFFSNAIVSGFTGSLNDAGRIFPGSLYAMYNLYVLGLFLLALIIFFYRAQKTEGQYKRNLKLITWSVFLGGLPAVLTDLILPISTHGVFPNALIGPIFTIVWLGGTTKIVLSQ